MKIALLGSNVSSTIGFRAELIETLVHSGHTVYCFCSDFDQKSEHKIELMGAIPIKYQLKRAGLNPISDILTIIQLKNILEEIKPDIVFSYFVKPVIYGTIAAKLAGIRRRVAMLEGLGYAFTELKKGFTLKQKILKTIQIALYKITLPMTEKVIFLNKDDYQDLIIRNNIILQSHHVLGGIGVDLSKFPYSPPPKKPIKFLFIGRLLAEKGIFEFVNAAKIVKRNHPDIEFIVLGGLDNENPGGLSKVQLSKLLDECVITYPGHVDDVGYWIKESSVFVLPSYREGMPRSSQEAMATGRAIITTDAPGCKDTVIEGENGFIIPRWDEHNLVNKMLFFIDNPDAIDKMGLVSNKIAIDNLDINKVNKKLISIIFD